MIAVTQYIIIKRAKKYHSVTCNQKKKIVSENRPKSVEMMWSE